MSSSLANSQHPIDSLYQAYISQGCPRALLMDTRTKISDLASRELYDNPHLIKIPINIHIPKSTTKKDLIEESLGLSIINAVTSCLEHYKGNNAIKSGFKNVLFASIKNEVIKNISKEIDSINSGGIGYHTETSESDMNKDTSSVRKTRIKIKKELKYLAEKYKKNPLIFESMSKLEKADTIARNIGMNTSTVLTYMATLENVVPFTTPSNDEDDSQEICQYEKENANKWEDPNKKNDRRDLYNLFIEIADEVWIKASGKSNEGIQKFRSIKFTYTICNLILNENLMEPKDMAEKFSRFPIMDKETMKRYLSTDYFETPTDIDLANMLGIKKITTEYERFLSSVQKLYTSKLL